MSTFLLIHGSWHGAWCWSRLVPLLEQRGHSAVAIDLPAHGKDATPAWRATLRGYGEAICRAGRGLGGKPILVGHSMGGMAISQAAALEPERFAALVFLCAFVPLPGERMLALARSDPASAVPSAMRLGPTSLRIRPERATGVFYDACRVEDADWATQQLCPDPLRPLLQRLQQPRPLDIPRGYIECTDDRAISIGWQRSMAERVSIARTITLETDHSPFLSAPEPLAAALEAMATLG